MKHGLSRLNSLSSSSATEKLLRCCSSVRWATSMADNRPFRAVEELKSFATSTWWSLETDDWMEAFSAHPKIGDAPASERHMVDWSSEEQSGVRQATADVERKLVEGNRIYETRFGFIYIICATGKSATEMLSALEERLENDPLDELQIAAEEQMKITLLRLDKLLDELEHND